MQLKFIKRFLGENLKKKFFEANSLPYLSPILLVKNLEKGMGFYVNY